MKKILVVTLFLLTVILGQAFGALENGGVRLVADVPFAFYAGGQLIPAGEYVFDLSALTAYSATGSAVRIHSNDGKVYVHMTAMRGEANSQAFTLTFARYGNTYFLSDIQNGAVTSRLHKSRIEKELQVANVSSSKDVVVASSTPE